MKIYLALTYRKDSQNLPSWFYKYKSCFKSKLNVGQIPKPTQLYAAHSAQSSKGSNIHSEVFEDQQAEKILKVYDTGKFFVQVEEYFKLQFPGKILKVFRN